MRIECCSVVARISWLIVVMLEGVFVLETWCNVG